MDTCCGSGIVGGGVSQFKVYGLRELEKALKDLGSDVAGKNGGLVRTALMGAALPVLRDAQLRAPVSSEDDDNLHIRDTITRSRQREVEPEMKPANEVGDVGLFARGKGKRIYYGKFLEFGTSRMSAQPFLRPALENNLVESTNLFRKKLAMGIVRVAKKVGNKNAASMGARIKKFS